MSLFFNNPLACIIFVLFAGFIVAQALPEERVDAIRL